MITDSYKDGVTKYTGVRLNIGWQVVNPVPYKEVLDIAGGKVFDSRGGRGGLRWRTS